MRNETKMQVMDFIGFLENSGKLSPEEQKRLREALEESLPRKNEPEKQVNVLTRADVAKMLKISSRTVDRMCENRTLKFWKLGPRYIRFNLGDVLELMQSPENSS